MLVGAKTTRSNARMPAVRGWLGPQPRGWTSSGTNHEGALLRPQLRHQRQQVPLDGGGDRANEEAKLNGCVR